MCIIKVTAHLEPRTNLIVAFHSGGKSLVVALHRYTLIVEIVERHVERAFVIASVCRNRIFLTQTVAVGCISPVVGHEHVLADTVGTCYECSKCGGGVEFSVSTDEGLTGRNIIYIVSQTVGCAVDEILVCPYVSRVSVISETVGCIVSQRSIVHLVVFCRTCHVFIVRYGT